MRDSDLQRLIERDSVLDHKTGTLVIGIGPAICFVSGSFLDIGLPCVKFELICAQ